MSQDETMQKLQAVAIEFPKNTSISNNMCTVNVDGVGKVLARRQQQQQQQQQQPELLLLQHQSLAILSFLRDNNFDTTDLRRQWVDRFGDQEDAAAVVGSNNNQASSGNGGSSSSATEGVLENGSNASSGCAAADLLAAASGAPSRLDASTSTCPQLLGEWKWIAAENPAAAVAAAVTEETAISTVVARIASNQVVSSPAIPTTVVNSTTDSDAAAKRKKTTGVDNNSFTASELPSPPASVHEPQKDGCTPRITFSSVGRATRKEVATSTTTTTTNNAKQKVDMDAQHPLPLRRSDDHKIIQTIVQNVLENLSQQPQQQPLTPSINAPQEQRNEGGLENQINASETDSITEVTAATPTPTSCSVATQTDDSFLTTMTVASSPTETQAITKTSTAQETRPPAAPEEKKTAVTSTAKKVAEDDDDDDEEDDSSSSYETDSSESEEEESDDDDDDEETEETETTEEDENEENEKPNTKVIATTKAPTKSMTISSKGAPAATNVKKKDDASGKSTAAGQSTNSASSRLAPVQRGIQSSASDCTGLTSNSSASPKRGVTRKVSFSEQVQERILEAYSTKKEDLYYTKDDIRRFKEEERLTKAADSEARLREQMATAFALMGIKM